MIANKKNTTYIIPKILPRFLVNFYLFFKTKTEVKISEKRKKTITRIESKFYSGLEKRSKGCG